MVTARLLRRRSERSVPSGSDGTWSPASPSLISRTSSTSSRSSASGEHGAACRSTREIEARRSSRRAAGPGCRPRCAGRGHRASAAARVYAGLGVVAHPLLGEVALGALRGQPLAVRQHHRAERRGDQQRAGDLEGEDVVAEQQLRDALDVAVLVAPSPSPVGGAVDRVPTAAISRTAKPTPSASPASSRWPRIVSTSESRRVDADQHQHEQEQHQDRAGVDDDLHGEQERRVLERRTEPPGRPSPRPAAARSARPCGRAPCRARPAP